jgi:hypothetical protein
MSEARIIEVEGEAAGIVIADGNGFSFYAASWPFYVMDGVHFRSPRDAEKAANRLITEAPARFRHS